MPRGSSTLAGRVHSEQWQRRVQSETPEKSNLPHAAQELFSRWQSLCSCLLPGNRINKRMDGDGQMEQSRDAECP